MEVPGRESGEVNLTHISSDPRILSLNVDSSSPVLFSTCVLTGFESATDDRPIPLVATAEIAKFSFENIILE